MLDRGHREFSVCGGSCFRKLEDRRTVINLAFINYYNNHNGLMNGKSHFLASSVSSVGLSHCDSKHAKKTVKKACK